MTATSNAICRIQFESVPLTESDVLGGTFPSGKDGWGTAAASPLTYDFRVQEVTYSPNATLLETSDELMGLNGPPQHSGAGQYAPQITLKLRCRPNGLAVLLFWICGSQDTTTGASGSVLGDGNTSDVTTTAVFSTPTSDKVATGTYQHHWQWSPATRIVPQTALVKFAPLMGTSPGNGWILSGAAVESAAFAFDSDNSLSVTLTIKGLYFTPANAGGSYPTFSLTPSFDTFKPYAKGNLSLDSGTTQLSNPSTSKVMDWNMTTTNTLDNYFAFTQNTLYPDSVEFSDVWPTVTGTLTKRICLASDYDAYRNATAVPATFYLKSTNYLTGTSPAKFVAWFPGMQYTNFTPDAITNKRLIGASFDYAGRLDGSSGSFAEFYTIDTMALTNFCVSPPVSGTTPFAYTGSI